MRLHQRTDQIEESVQAMFIRVNQKTHNQCFDISDPSNNDRARMDRAFVVSENTTSAFR